MSYYYNEGYDAFADYASVDDNPYGMGTYAHTQWEMGWTAADDAYYDYTGDMT